MSPPRSRSRGIIAELVGPAGCGKSTLLRELARRSSQVVPGPEPTRAELLPHYARHALELLPSCLRAPRSARAFREREARAMTYVRAWYEPALRLAHDEGRHVLMDHGPVFRLAFLAEFGSPLTRTPAFRRWWERSFRLWERSLDLLVCLDAPDAVLIQRVRDRDLGHAIKDGTALDASVFLGRYRKGFQHVMGRFGPHAPLAVRFDSSAEDVEAIADQVLEALAERAYAA